LYGVFPEIDGRTALDFGCGEGIICSYLRNNGAKQIVGIDQIEEMISIGKKHPAFDLRQGSVEKLSCFEENQFDLIVAANVIDYFSDQENQIFYNEAGRLLKPKGYLVVSHSDELFDFLTFKKYTVAFFNKHFKFDPSTLITNPDLPERNSFNQQKNPLTYEE